MKDIDLIQKYLDGDLEADAKQEVEARLQSDAAFAKNLETEKRIHQGIQSFGNKDLQGRLEKMYDASEEEATAIVTPIKRSSSNRLRYLALAATFLLAIVALFWLLNRPPAHEQLFAQYYEALPPNSVRGIPSDNLQLKQAEEAYQNKNYEEVYSLLKGQAAEVQSQGGLLASYGIAQLETNRTDEALQSFQQLSRMPRSKAIASWYTALIFIKQNKLEEAKALLIQFSNGSLVTSKKRKEQALQLLKALEE